MAGGRWEQTASSAGSPDTDSPSTLGIQAQILASSCAFWKVLKKTRIFNSMCWTFVKNIIHKQAAHLIYKPSRTFLKLKVFSLAAMWKCQQGMLPVSRYRKSGALPGMKLSVIRRQTVSLHPPPPQGPNWAALPPLCVSCPIRTEELCGHGRCERMAVKRPASSCSELPQQKSIRRVLIGWRSPNDTLSFPGLTGM